MASGFRPLETDTWKRTIRRTLIIGPPHKRKTTSLHSWPRPIHIVSYPGEKGAGSIVPLADVKGYVWEEDATQTLTATQKWELVRATTLQILAGKHGPITTFAGDGLHKLYEVIYDYCLETLVAHSKPDVDPDRLGGRAFGEAHKVFLKYLTEVNQSTVPYTVFTCWSQKEKDDPQNADPKAPAHIWPDLRGQMAQWVLGEFSVVMYAEVGLPNANGQSPAYWQLRPAGKVWGVGVKAPAHIAAGLPERVPQDWAKLEPLLLGFTGEVASDGRIIKPAPQPAASPSPTGDAHV